MVQNHPTSFDFEDAASKILKKSKNCNLHSMDCRFRQHFGTTSAISQKIWQKLDPLETIEKEHKGVKIKHLLWALLFMKTYSKESVHSSLVGGVDEKTFRKWAWIFVEAISYLECDVVRLRTYH